MKLSVGYPDQAAEAALLAAAVSVAKKTSADQPTDTAALAPGQLADLQALVAATAVAANVQHYLVALAAATRSHPDISAGVSPRGLLLWQRAAQATARLAGRDFTTPDDVQQVAVPVLAVRLGIEAADTAGVIERLLETVPVPTTPAG